MTSGEGRCMCGRLTRVLVGCLTGLWRYCPGCHVTHNTATHVALDSQGREIRWQPE